MGMWRFNKPGDLVTGLVSWAHSRSRSPHCPPTRISKVSREAFTWFSQVFGLDVLDSTDPLQVPSSKPVFSVRMVA